MRIAELARRSGTTTRALRYGEEQGVLRAARTGNGYRDYAEESLPHVRQIQGLLEAGFGSRTVAQLLPCAHGNRLAIELCPHRRRRDAGKPGPHRVEAGPPERSPRRRVRTSHRRGTQGSYRLSPPGMPPARRRVATASTCSVWPACRSGTAVRPDATPWETGLPRMLVRRRPSRPLDTVVSNGRLHAWADPFRPSGDGKSRNQLLY